MRRINLALLSAAFLLYGTGVLADMKVTVGVGHMCCGKCKAAANEALAKVASNVTIEGKDITMTVKGDDLFPMLEALRKASAPAIRIDAGSGPITMTVSHLCCGSCRSSLTKTLTGSGVEALDPASVKVGEDSVTVKAKEGKTLDLAPVLAAMEKGGFAATKITMGAAAARSAGKTVTTASAK